MSLNGLDNDAVTQAHQTTLVEAGGWFLLKYANRDTVELLDKGTGGVSEARSAVERYEEKSPLYGLVQYRRKKVVLKYVPEGTSRLLQVRLAVQFQSILDAIVPHDTVFSFTAPDELTESTLGLCTMKLQHAASTTSSSSSLRQRRLNEIAEDAEESTTTEVAAAAPVMHTTITLESRRSEDTSTLPASALRAKALLAKRKQEDAREEQGSGKTNSVEHSSEKEGRTWLVPNTDNGPVSPLTDTFGPTLDKAVSPDSEGTQPKSSIAISRPSFDFPIPDSALDSDDDIRRPIPKEYPPAHYSNHLSAAETSNISRWTDDVVASTKKQKRAPRPHVDTQVRPKTSGTTDDVASSRRVANLPTTVRVSNRMSSQPSRPGSQQSTRSVPTRFVPSASLPPPVPSSTFPLVSAPRQKSRPSLSQASSTANDSSSVTPEKMRLMKALQMRKRNQLLAQRSASAVSSTPVPFTSIDSSRSGTSDSPTAQSVSISSFSANPEAVSTGQELGSINESETTSPTSVVTASDNHSTKPSSLFETSGRRRSQTSVSSDTNSLTTPKADSENKRQQSPESETPSAKEDRTDVVLAASLPQVVSSPIDIERSNVESLLPSVLSDGQEEAFGQREHENRGRTLIGGDLPNESNKSLSPLPQTKKRYHFEGSIRIPPSTQGSDVSDDDESFMEELQHATVHEAKPISVNRTPITPVLQKTPTKEFQPTQIRTTTPRSASAGSQSSTPDRRRAASRAGSTRSISTALPQWPPPPTEPVPALPKQKQTLGSSISKRIKVLEGLSQRDNNPSVGSAKDATPRGSGISTILKRTSFLTSLSNVNAVPEKTSPRTASSPLRADFENEETQSGLRPLVQRQGTSTEVYSPAHKGESVTVTARIVRDPPKSAHGTSDTTRNMHRSPLIVEHETSDGTNARPMLPRETTTQSTESIMTSPGSERRRFSFSSYRSAAQKPSPTEPKSHRLSFSSHQKKASKAPSETSSVAEDKRTSRTNRMLKRLSGLGKSRNPKELMSSPTRDIPQPKTIQEQAEVDSDVRHVVDIGEVNVQFPETLLWKRRFLRVDDQGYLIFAPPTNDHSTRGRSRKIHLDEFARPSLPDMEREEMAWSIVLDLKDGRCVQCACESREAQRSTLKLLTDAHGAYHQLYPSS